MRIILVNTYWYWRGGSEKVVFLTKKVLEDAGHEVAVFGMKDSRNLLENEYFAEESDYNIFKPQSHIVGAYLWLKHKSAFPLKTYNKINIHN